eukprot:TRINITY_DN869_c0_g3_i3.p1 TRINITY_DN869_c0_g3~~TRINITY_DN869_c0_g3_i3.p1  ORF type:complete len:678 (-),score=156.83 TRINITY_DN869_c0_g3_i3:45-2078(-)
MKETPQQQQHKLQSHPHPHQRSHPHNPQMLAHNKRHRQLLSKQEDDDYDNDCCDHTEEESTSSPSSSNAALSSSWSSSSSSSSRVATTPNLPDHQWSEIFSWVGFTPENIPLVCWRWYHVFQDTLCITANHLWSSSHRVDEVKLLDVVSKALFERDRSPLTLFQNAIVAYKVLLIAHEHKRIEICKKIVDLDQRIDSPHAKFEVFCNDNTTVKNLRLVSGHRFYLSRKSWHQAFSHFVLFFSFLLKDPVEKMRQQQLLQEHQQEKPQSQSQRSTRKKVKKVTKPRRWFASQSTQQQQQQQQNNLLKNKSTTSITKLHDSSSSSSSSSTSTPLASSSSSSSLSSSSASTPPITKRIKQRTKFPPSDNRTYLESLKLYLNMLKVYESIAKSCFEFCCRTGQLGAARYLIEQHPHFKGSKRACSSAARYGHADIVDMLLQEDEKNPAMVDPSSFHNEIIRHASFRGHYEVVKRLLADKRVHPEDSVTVAAICGHADVVKLLLDDRRSDPLRYNVNALQKAVSRGHHRVVRLLLADGRVQEILESNFYGYLLWASMKYDRHRVFKMLLDYNRVDVAPLCGVLGNGAVKKGKITALRILITHPRFDPTDGARGRVFSILKKFQENSDLCSLPKHEIEDLLVLFVKLMRLKLRVQSNWRKILFVLVGFLLFCTLLYWMFMILY